MAGYADHEGQEFRRLNAVWPAHAGHHHDLRAYMILSVDSHGAAITSRSLQVRQDTNALTTIPESSRHCTVVVVQAAPGKRHAL